jgi:hypothetical protein
MISRKTKLLSTAIAAVALIATVAVASTVHTRMQASNGDVVGAVPGQFAAFPQHGVVACGMTSRSDCETIKMMLPM